MKRKDIIEKLLFEGFSEKTLSRLSDGQLSTLAKTVLSEEDVMISKKDPQLTQKVANAKKSNQTIVTYEEEMKEDETKIPNKDEIASKLDSIRSGAKRDDMIKQGAYDGRFREKTIKDKKKEESKYSARGKKSYELDEESSNKMTMSWFKTEMEKKLGRKVTDEEVKAAIKKMIETPVKRIDSSKKEKGINETKAAAAMWKGVKRESMNEWVMDLTESKFSQFTSKSDILSIITEKIRETASPMPMTKATKGHNGVPEFMTYDSIVGNQPETKPNEPEVIPDAPPTEKPSKPKTPYEPGPGKDPKPKAMGEEKKKK